MGCPIKERYMGCPNYNIIKYRWLLYPLLIIIFWPLTMAVPRNKKNNEKDIVYKYNSTCRDMIKNSWNIPKG
jgi:hypothetical protein